MNDNTHTGISKSNTVVSLYITLFMLPEDTYSIDLCIMDARRSRFLNT